MAPWQADFASFESVLRGEKKPDRVYLAELKFDEEIIQHIARNTLGFSWPELPEEDPKKIWILDCDSKRAYWKVRITFFGEMGYDFMRAKAVWKGFPQTKSRATGDSAALTRGTRNWVEEGGGIISTWEDYEAISWDDIKADLAVFEFLEKHIPTGMKIMINTNMFETVLEYLMGYEGLFFALHDDPKLAQALFDRWGQVVYEFYESLIARQSVGGIFHCDDLGFKTGTFLAPEMLRRLVFPWHKQYADLAHKHGKMCWLHSCGNLNEVMDDLIDYVGFDAIHSYQDIIMPVTEFRKKYGNRIASLGGVDVDKLARLPESELRTYVRGILDSCMSSGRYALGSGNSITNYIPPENYLIMRDEAIKWQMS